LRKKVVTTATPDAIAAPLRTCVGCRSKRPQHDLVRCALGSDGPTVSRVAPGRGAWLCSVACLHTAIRRKAFERAWKRAVPAQEFEGVLNALQNAFGPVITNMEELPTAGSTGVKAPTKG
jgi:predicted RNA-binding protein YlxR (DUF448 family)